MAYGFRRLEFMMVEQMLGCRNSWRAPVWSTSRRLRGNTRNVASLACRQGQAASLACPTGTSQLRWLLFYVRGRLDNEVNLFFQDLYKQARSEPGSTQMRTFQLMLLSRFFVLTTQVSMAKPCPGASECDFIQKSSLYTDDWLKLSQKTEAFINRGHLNIKSCTERYHGETDTWR